MVPLEGRAHPFVRETSPLDKISCILTQAENRDLMEGKLVPSSFRDGLAGVDMDRALYVLRRAAHVLVRRFSALDEDVALFCHVGGSLADERMRSTGSPQWEGNPPPLHTQPNHRIKSASDDTHLDAYTAAVCTWGGSRWGCWWEEMMRSNVMKYTEHSKEHFSTSM